MVESGQREVIDIAYDNPVRRDTNLEVLTFDTLKPRLKSTVTWRPSRLDFHQVMVVHGGTGTAMVDFVTYPCTRGTVLHLRPGQVQRLPYDADGRPADLDATLVLFTGDFPPPLPQADEVLDGLGPVAWQLPRDEFESFDRAVTELGAEYRTLLSERTDAQLTGALLRQLVGALLIRIARLQTATSSTTAAPSMEVYLAFRRELERGFATSRSVEDYASRLGYAPRTVTRACQAATGRSAKQLADARVTLEAQRLLAHTDLPVAAIARSVGFSEATNFGKFFARETGRAPGEFRRAQRAS
jgi:AraC-like DNA-binding protein